MRSFAIISIAALLAPFTAAELHTNGVCVDWVGGAAVYNAAATEAACGNYLMRNTGSEQWDTCPDCKMVSFLKLFCISVICRIFTQVVIREEHDIQLKDSDMKNMLTICIGNGWGFGLLQLG